MPLNILSIIIPVYNTAAYLRRCVESVLSQTYRQQEIILVDDGSTDGSDTICDELAKEDNRIIVVHQLNGGSSEARNAGLRIAKGDYVVFLDSDDMWLVANGVEQMMERLEKYHSDILLFKRVDVYPKRQSTGKEYDIEYIRSHSAQEVFERLAEMEQLSLSSCFQLVRRQILTVNNIEFPIGIISGEDTVFSCLVWQNAEKVDVLNLNMYAYCHRAGSVTTSYSIKNLLSYDKLFAYWKEQIANQCVNYKGMSILLANMYVSSCYSYYSISYKNRKYAENILLKHQDLLNFPCSRKSLRMKKLVNVVGIRWGIVLFATYGWLKRLYLNYKLK